MAKQIRDNEVDINGKKFGESTIITINLKTLVIIIGLIISGLTTAYVSLSSKISNYATSTQTDIKDLSKDMKELRQQELPKMREDVSKIDTKVQIIYDFVNRSNYQQIVPNNTPGNNSISNQTPQMPR
jgi:ABC-type phosphate/phosphonate transport system ATPase subunit